MSHLSERQADDHTLSTKKLINTAIITIGSDRSSHARREFGVTDDVHDGVSVRGYSGQFNSVVTPCRLVCRSNERFDVRGTRKYLRLDVGDHSPGTEDPGEFLTFHGISDHRGTLVEARLCQVRTTSIIIDSGAAWVAADPRDFAPTQWGRIDSRMSRSVWLGGHRGRTGVVTREP